MHTYKRCMHLPAESFSNLYKFCESGIFKVSPRKSSLGLYIFPCFTSSALDAEGSRHNWQTNLLPYKRRVVFLLISACFYEYTTLNAWLMSARVLQCTLASRNYMTPTKWQPSHAKCAIFEGMVGKKKRKACAMERGRDSMKRSSIRPQFHLCIA
jgi:hypothetical protein